jgi:hypothetical protein
MRFGAILAVAVTAILVPVGGAGAATITEVISFSANHFSVLQNGPTPVSPVMGTFTLTFDPTLDYLSDTTAGLTLDSLNVASDSQAAFTYSASTGAFVIGGLAHGIEGFGANTNDFSFHGQFIGSSLWFRSLLYSTASNNGFYYSQSGSASPMSPPVAVAPLPAALPLFGAALLGLGFIATRRKKQGSLPAA